MYRAGRRPAARRASPSPSGPWRSRRSAPMPTSCSPRRVPRAWRRPRRSTRAASRPASSPSGRRPSRRMSATSGASSRPGPTCAPAPGSPSALGLGGPRRGDRPLSRDAPAQSGRQPGPPLRPRRRPAQDRRRRGPADSLAYDDDGSPYWTYTKALLAFRAGGATEEAGRLLAEAVRSNGHVPAFLSGRRTSPRPPPPSSPWAARTRRPSTRGIAASLEAHGRRARMAPAGGRRAPTPVPARPSGDPLSDYRGIAVSVAGAHPVLGLARLIVSGVPLPR